MKSPKVVWILHAMIGAFVVYGLIKVGMSDTFSTTKKAVGIFLGAHVLVFLTIQAFWLTRRLRKDAAQEAS